MTVNRPASAVLAFALTLAVMVKMRFGIVGLLIYLLGYGVGALAHAVFQRSPLHDVPEKLRKHFEDDDSCPRN